MTHGILGCALVTVARLPKSLSVPAMERLRADNARIMDTLEGTAILHGEWAAITVQAVGTPRKGVPPNTVGD